MTKVWAVFFITGFICASSQYIYLNEQNDCKSNEKNTGTLSTLLDELRKIQREVHQLRREDIEIRDMQTNLTLLSKVQHQVDELRMENVELRELITNLTSTSKLQKEVEELRRGYREMKDLLTNLSLTGLKLTRDCKDHYLLGNTQSGVYEINPFGNEIRVSVYCDMVTEGGGWTAIQKRGSGSVSFYRTWAEYKKGFGNPYDTYWIGNDMIHQLTKGNNTSLYVSITLQDGITLYERYQQFFVSEESDKYRLYLGGPTTGTLGDAMLDTDNPEANLSGMSFSTPDRDNDGHSNGHCASGNRGGWWFNNCQLAFLNGPWSPEQWVNPWFPIVQNGLGITQTLMMIKPY
ncbi:fibroleukin-like [Saccostrea cucullata]|uniref:fibroleukin-like n=1 Tax=Saccostrea cuccullata TaxID=36930 RepID=UPI002ED6BC30